MFCTQRKWCDIVVCTLADIHIERLNWDSAFLYAIIPKLQDFYFNAILPELAVPTLHKGGICEPSSWMKDDDAWKRDTKDLKSATTTITVPILGHSLTDMSTHSLVRFPEILTAHGHSHSVLRPLPGNSITAHGHSLVPAAHCSWPLTALCPGYSLTPLSLMATRLLVLVLATYSLLMATHSLLMASHSLLQVLATYSLTAMATHCSWLLLMATQSLLQVLATHSLTAHGHSLTHCFRSWPLIHSLLMATH